MGTLCRAEVSATAPSSPNEVDLWWDSTSVTLKIYYDDGTSQQRVDALPTISNDFVEKSTAIITTPEGVQLANAVTDETFTLEASEYFNLLGLDHASSF